jgi:hypothetical protein
MIQESIIFGAAIFCSIAAGSNVLDELVVHHRGKKVGDEESEWTFWLVLGCAGLWGYFYYLTHI